MRFMLTGGSGLIGRALADSLAADGHEVILLSRSPGNVVGLPEGVRAVYWDARTTEGWGELVDGAAAVIHLAGESLAGDNLFNIRWTPARKRRLYDSRVKTGQVLLEAIEAARERPAVLVQQSGVNYYGTRDENPATEEHGPGDDFLARLCVDWEGATARAERMGVRRVVTRTAVVLSDRGGVLPLQMLPFRFFVGGPIGSGRQWYPWIHIQDEVRAIRFLIDNPEAKGPFNLCAPGAVTNAEFSRALGRAMGRPAAIPAPAFAFKLAFGEASMLLLEGRRIIPQRLQEMGFEFRFPEVEPALRDLLSA